jgi:hypothetical protein
MTPSIYLEDFTVKVITPIMGVLAAAIGAWLHARYGRKVRLKIGEVEAEAQTVEEVEKPLDRAELSWPAKSLAFCTHDWSDLQRDG